MVYERYEFGTSLVYILGSLISRATYALFQIRAGVWTVCIGDLAIPWTLVSGANSSLPLAAGRKCEGSTYYNFRCQLNASLFSFIFFGV